MRDLRDLLTPEVLERCGLAKFDGNDRYPWSMTRATLEEFIKVVEESAAKATPDHSQPQWRKPGDITHPESLTNQELGTFGWPRKERPRTPQTRRDGQKAWYPDANALAALSGPSPLEAAVIETIVTRPVAGQKWRVCLCSWGLGRQHFRPQCEGAAHAVPPD